MGMVNAVIQQIRYSLLFLLLALQPLQGLSAPSHITAIPRGRRQEIAAAGYIRPESTSQTTPAASTLSRNMLSALRSTGGAAVTEMDPDDKEAKIAKEALSSMQFCYKAAFFSVLVDVVLVLLQNDIRLNKLTWIQGFELLDSLNLLALGAGIRRVSTIYSKALMDGGSNSAAYIFDLCNIMAGIWQRSAWVIVMASMLMASKLTHFTNVWIGPGSVAALAIMGNVLIRKSAASRAQEVGKVPPKDINMEATRTMGFLAGRNMAFCMGAFWLKGLTQLVVTLTTATPGVMDKVFGLSDVLESVIIARLLMTLNSNFYKAVVNVTNAKLAGKKGIYNDLYEAQKGFYSKVGNTMASQSVFKLLPEILAAAKFAWQLK